MSLHTLKHDYTFEADQCDNVNLDDDCQMGKKLDWQAIGTAPGDADLELSIYVPGEYVALVFPCRRHGLGWRDAKAGRRVLVKPTHWRRWKGRRVR